MKEPLSVYIHIPFCVRKCRYCDFFSAPCGDTQRKAYTAALVREIREYPLLPEDPAYAESGKYDIVSVYIGGGTPSVLKTEETESILAAVFDRFGITDPGQCEITMEINPGTVTPEDLHALRQAGINRLSVGVQSFNDSELALLGRIHTAADACAALDAAKRAGFENISLDLIGALPGQTMPEYMYSVKRAVSLKPQHISVYSLIIEPGTVFAGMLEENRLPELPDEDTERQMAYDCQRYLEENGYRRYEISNYSLPGYMSRHNTGYWTLRQYRGFGAGASSLVGETRFTAAADTDGYIRAVNAGEKIPCTTEHLTQKDRMEEFMFLGLRMRDGVSRTDFEMLFGCSVDEVYGNVLRRQEENGLIICCGGRIMLTDHGTDVSNLVMAEFLLD